MKKKKKKNNYVWCKKILYRFLIYDKGIFAFLGRGVIHPGVLNANQGTHVAILLWSFFVLLLLVFFFSFFPQMETSLHLSWRLSSILEGRSLPSPQQEKGRSLCQLVGSCGKLARCGACPGGGAALLQAVAADWEPGGNGCLKARYFLAISSCFVGKGGIRK